MAMSSAQRQAAFRARHLKDENGKGERLSLVIDLHAGARAGRSLLRP
jgi:hypothetical protein